MIIIVIVEISKCSFSNSLIMRLDKKNFILKTHQLTESNDLELQGSITAPRFIFISKAADIRRASTTVGRGTGNSGKERERKGKPARAPVNDFNISSNYIKKEAE